MNGKKKTVIGVLIAFCICLIGTLLLFFARNAYFKEISLAEFEAILNDGGNAIVYYGQESCGECSVVEPLVKDAAKKEKIKVKYLDADKINDSSNLKKLGIEMTPTMAVIKNGEVKVYEELDRAKISNILKNLDGTYVDRPSGLAEISYEQVMEKMTSGADFILYIGRPDCRDCQKFHPIVEEYTGTEDASGLYYMNIKEFRDKSRAENASDEDVRFYKELTERFDIKWVPSVYHIVDGTISSKYEFLDKAYYEIEDEKEKEKVVDEYVSNFYAWMGDSNQTTCD